MRGRGIKVGAGCVSRAGTALGMFLGWRMTVKVMLALVGLGG